MHFSLLPPLVPGLAAQTSGFQHTQWLVRAARSRALTAGSECPSRLLRLPLPRAPSPGAFPSEHPDPWGYFTPSTKFKPFIGIISGFKKMH